MLRLNTSLAELPKSMETVTQNKESVVIKSASGINSAPRSDSVSRSPVFGEREGKLRMGRGEGRGRTRPEGGQPAGVDPGRRPKFPQGSAWENGGALAGARGQVGAGRHPESPGAGGVCRGLEARQALEELPGKLPRRPPSLGLGPRARARLPRRLTPLPPARPARACPGLPRLSLAARLGPSSSGTPRSRDPLPLFSSPSPAARLANLRLYLPRERGVEAPGPCRRVSAAGPQPFPAAASHYALRRGAARGWRAAVSAGRGWGRRSERAERGHTAALRPTGEEQPRRSPPREGGWAAAWGGVSRPPQWLPRSQVDLRPRPGAATSAAPHTPHPPTRGSPGCVGPETRAHRCWRLAGSVTRSESRAWRETQPGTRGAPEALPEACGPPLSPEGSGKKQARGPPPPTAARVSAPVSRGRV
ncbi:uncharacterized protein LOC110294861 [Mus caroli]|uniref:Uncharacterized protein LOC110294861 n=1 Tax=Mus caroli TaxID=10089 RepID=A0A6P5PLV5_MUSCR|nr:uncharacterized protein LOC110294861 [Mus caroli]